ncbi:hypothetical protein [Catalinimonas alkaloidigena]|uniref:hypothetical protein n=1 Tax=Catalinimonas alkaloidigena TaxID=1075417 RepID=UPI00115FC7CE|nr:hypothetical protein [Catalinimonas alkaloidigena]
MKLFPEQLFHLYNRGNNRQPIFFEGENLSLLPEQNAEAPTPSCGISGVLPDAESLSFFGLFSTGV